MNTLTGTFDNSAATIDTLLPFVWPAHYHEPAYRSQHTTEDHPLCLAAFRPTAKLPDQSTNYNPNEYLHIITRI